MGEVIPLPARPAPRGSDDARPPLWREAVGRELREERGSQERNLTDVATGAGVSMQYLSEVERGLKEPSSEVIAAVAGELGLRLVDLTARVTRRLASTSPTGPVCLAA
jgi:transcriptional regulator with XRE-family HTH domain